MIQAPLHSGWEFVKSCNCGGNYQEWFKKGTMMLKVFPNNNRWNIQNAGTTLKHGDLSQLNANLN